MGILNRASDGLPTVLNALRRTAKVVGPVNSDELLRLCAPTTLVPDGKPEMARKTLTRWTQLGMFTADADRVRLSDEFAAGELDDLEGFQHKALRLVLRPGNSPSMEERGGENQEPLASDFVRAAAWVLAQDPYRRKTDWDAVSALQAKQRVHPLAFQNNTRWDGFSDWAPYLGIAETIANEVVFNPHRAVRGCLSELFETSATLPMQEFIGRLAARLPILDQGSMRLAVENMTEELWRKVGASELSPTMSLALLTLESTGALRLEDRADAKRTILTGKAGRPLRNITHLTKGANA